jgi:SnoaL-like domain
VTELETLVETEKVKKVRILYSHYFDMNHLDKLVALFTPDAICEFGERGTCIGHKQIRAIYEQAHEFWDKKKQGPYPYVHAITNHWIEFTAQDTAEGRCYLIDMVTCQENTPLLLIGVYDDEYKKVGGNWLIHRTRLDYLWPERALVGGFPGQRVPPAVSANRV